MIRIDGHLGGTALSAFLAPAPEQRGARILLTVLLDQSALYGVLEEIGALVLDLLDIRKLTPEHRSQITRTQITRTRRQPLAFMTTTFGHPTTRRGCRRLIRFSWTSSGISPTSTALAATS